MQTKYQPSAMDRKLELSLFDKPSAMRMLGKADFRESQKKYEVAIADGVIETVEKMKNGRMEPGNWASHVGEVDVVTREWAGQKETVGEAGALATWRDG